MKKRLVLTAVIASLVLVAGCGKDEKKAADPGTQTQTENAGTQTESTETKTETEEVQTEVKEASAAEIGTELREKITYSDELSEIDTDTAKMYIYLDDVSIDEAKIYESTGATAEEIVVLKCSSADDASKAKSAFEQRIEEQKEAYTDYVPEELVKLSKPVIITNGEYAILSVSDEPDKAKEIIGAYFK
ncbi:MAG: DUF4358 domain-containing protein [Lachnospiraceae bacterium]|nr:DUF4358 domain-containing protein [Lachnospiraceae bacterium]